jgi:nudix-type nucleoside diphosphatase (YffH/AdpP family)
MDRTVRIIQRRELFHRFFFRIEEVTLQHERYDGTLSEEMQRLIVHRGDSVAMLLSDIEHQCILLCEQFRVPTYDKGPGWLLEVPAGTLELGENPEECARRETLEETGYQVKALHRIACVYLSPGGSSERVFIFHAEVSLADKIAAGGGNASEAEDIKLICLPIADAISKARDGQIQDAKTLIALQWLQIATGAR